MGAPQQQAKVLRIGIIQGGKITEERLISRGETVTIGEAPDNTFVLPKSSLPNSFPLFVANGSDYSLTFNKDIQGKVSVVNGAVQDLEALRNKQETKRDKGNFIFPLTAEMRGKVTFADVSILFQFVPPPVAPIGGVGGEFYLSWRSRVDWLMASVFLASLIVHFSFVLYVRALEPPPEPTFAEIPDGFVKLLKQPEPPPPPPPEEGPGEEKKVDDSKDKAPDDGSKQKEKKDLTKEERQAAAKEKVLQKGLLAVIGAKGRNNGPAVVDIMDSGPGGDLDSFLKSDASLAKAGTGGLRTGDFGHAPVSDVDGPVIANTQVDVDKHKSSGPKAKFDAAQDVVGALDSKKINSAVNKYRAALETCHTRALNINPSVSGRVVVSITLDNTGKVLDVAVVENTTGSTELEKCLLLRMKRWQFPAFEGGDAQFNLPFLFTATG